MPVFKGAMKVARQNMGLIVMYIVIVASVLNLTIHNHETQQSSEFTAHSLKISFVDLDNSPLSQALAAELAQTHKLKTCRPDSSFLLEELYYRNSDYVLQVPAGFGADPQKNSLQITEVPGSYTGFYLNSQIENYLRQVKFYTAGGFSQAEAIQRAGNTQPPSVSFLEASPTEENALRGFFQFIPYGAICMLCYIVGSVLCAFMKKETRKRIGASALTYRRFELELLLAVIVFALIIYTVFLIMGTAFYGLTFWTSPNLALYLTNMGAMVLVSLSISYLIAMVSNGPEALSGIVNSVSLGLSFLCGVFVPLEILGKGVQTVAQFLPFYWYEKATLLLSQTAALTASQNKELYLALGIQAVFAIAFISIGAAIHKERV